MLKFFVYTLTNPIDKRVFYIGKGQGLRAYSHEQQALRGHSCHKCNLIRQMFEKGEGPEINYIFETNDEQEAFEKEVELIAFYPNLVNQTLGGEGVSGYNPPKEVRERISKSLLGTKRSYFRLVSEETRQKMSEGHLGKTHSLETRIKRANSNTGKRHSKETKAKIGASRSGQTASEEARAKMSAARMGERNNFYGQHHSRETCEKISAARQKYVRESPRMSLELKNA